MQVSLRTPDSKKNVSILEEIYTKITPVIVIKNRKNVSYNIHVYVGLLNTKIQYNQI